MSREGKIARNKLEERVNSFSLSTGGIPKKGLHRRRKNTPWRESVLYTTSKMLAHDSAENREKRVPPLSRGC
jgi:hypothetical protein